MAAVKKVMLTHIFENVLKSLHKKRLLQSCTGFVTLHLSLYSLFCNVK